MSPALAEQITRKSEWLGEQIETLDPSEHRCLREAGERARDLGMAIVALGEEEPQKVGKVADVFESMTGKFGEAVKEAKRHEQRLAD